MAVRGGQHAKSEASGSKEPRQPLAATGTPVKPQDALARTRAHNCRSRSSPLVWTVTRAGAATPEQDPGATEEGLRSARPADLAEVSQNLLT